MLVHQKNIRRAVIYAVLLIVSVPPIVGIGSCSSNNCPLENFVGCNIWFYDSEGSPITYTGEITVTTLLPGNKLVYTYRKLGEQTVVKDWRDEALVELGYTETVSETRRDTILVNKAVSRDNIEVGLAYFQKCDTLIFSYSEITSSDTIRIMHDSYPHVDLPECGAYRFHTLTGVTSTEAGIDHVEIVNPTVNYEGNENIRIYFNGVAE
ncbi:MAG: DUF6452 family protein [Bacteroides sp.]|nr:DUF6452 family protein [Roseburia sp.]MCM1347520.1 DUF6452 family protein [Bacteroides sp.]MCM1422002.1 DUF6452 family protein [Bacteroides sp.]